MGVDRKLFGLVLAGGHSRRMGTPKAMIAYHGKPQAEHSCDLLRDVCERVFLSLRPDQAANFAAVGVDKIYDAYPDAGPIGGILSAMDAHPDVSWVVLGCDLPFLTSEGIASLVNQRRGDCWANAYRGARDGLPEPLCAIYEPSAAPSLKEEIASGRCCPRKWFLNHPESVGLVDLADQRLLGNINTPQEQQEALKRIRR